MYTFFWCTGIVTAILSLLVAFWGPGTSMIHNIIALSCACSIPIGLRPIMGLFAIPNTLYLKHDKLCLQNGEYIDIQDIKTLWIKKIGFGANELKYYEIELTESKALSRKNKRKSILTVERYNILYIFRYNTSLINILIDLGLKPKQIENSKIKLKHLLGIRDRFIK